MLSTRSERIAFALTLVVIVALGSLMAYGVLQYRKEPKSGAPAASAVDRLVQRHRMSQGTAPASPRPMPPRRPAPVTPPAPDVTATPASVRKPVVRPARVTLRLAAARGDCWVEVRRNSGDGDVLFAAILPKGDFRTFRGKRLWIRLGAPEAVDATLGGKPAEIPGGTLNVLATPRGLRSA